MYKRCHLLPRCHQLRSIDERFKLLRSSGDINVHYDIAQVEQDGCDLRHWLKVELKGRTGEKKAAIGVPVKLSETPGSVRSAAVDFGESTTSILRELGYSEKKIKEFAQSEVI